MTATAFEIARVWDTIVHDKNLCWVKSNWAQGPDGWWIDDNTYINGVACYIDRDYEVAYLLEIGDQRVPGDTVYSYLAIVYTNTPQRGEERHVVWYQDALNGQDKDEDWTLKATQWFVSQTFDILRPVEL